MATLLSSARSTKPIRLRDVPTVAQIIERTPVVPASPDPWYEGRTPRPTAPEWLVFGARVRHAVIPGTWKVVREAARYGNGRDWLVRVREQAGDGSLFGPVLSWKVGEVAGLATAEPAPAIAIVNTPAPADDKPLTVAMVISIDGTHYAVAPLAPAPDAVKAFRLEKIGGDEAVYDVEELAGVSRCDCADFVFRREGLDTIGCKHIRAAWMMGLIGEYTPAPGGRLVDPAPATLVSNKGGDAEPRHDDASPCCPADEPMPCTGCLSHEGPADLSDDGWDDDHIWTISDVAPEPDDDAEVLQLIEDGAELEAEGEEPLGYATPECFTAVSEGRADWAREFGLVPCPGWVTPENRADLLADDAIDGGWASRPRGYFEGLLAGAFDGEVPAPDPDEPAARSLAEQVDEHARELRAIGSPLHDLLAERAEALAGEIRYLDATTVGQYRDRREAALDAARDAAEARMASRCCC